MRNDLSVAIPAGKRSDIQGLRALAVLAVVLFHAGFFPNSGFIGVDIFFVISGFVISKLLITEFDKTGNVDFPRFYLRRFLRLLPGLGLVIGVFSILAFFLISPLGMQQNSAKTGIGALFISANWVMAKVTQGYFDLPAETNIFLHTWSLSVEEQFYLLFPLLIFLIISARKMMRKTISFTIPFLLIFLTSITIYLGLLQISVSTSSGWLNGFYSPLTRSWEFLIGALAFLFSRSAKPNKFIANNFSISVAAVVLLGSILAPQKLLEFPSPYLAIPLFCTFTLLYGGTYSIGVKGNIFDNQFMTYIGDRSYAIYLWHWPAIMLAKYIYPENGIALLLMLFSSIGLSFFAYSKVENPIRKGNYQNRIFLVKTWIAFFPVPLLLCLSLGYIASEVSFKKYESGEVVGHYQGDIGAIGFDSFSSQYPAICSVPAVAGEDPIIGCNADVAVIGDSHAQHLLPGFSHNFPGIKFVGLDSNFLHYRQNSEYVRRLKNLDDNSTIRVVIVNAYWAPNSVPDDLAPLVRSLTSHGKKVIVLDDVPNFPFDAFTCKYGISTFIDHFNCEMGSKKFFSQRNRYVPALVNSVNRDSQAELFHTSNLFCTAKTCSMVKNGVLNYLDLNHLNVNGSKYITGEVARNSKFFCSTFAEKLSDSEFCQQN